MKIAVCITTINPPTGSITRWVEQGFILYVAGDKKTPETLWANLHDNVKYLTPREQAARWPCLSRVIGWNTYLRKHFAYLAAMADRPDVIFETDDDNAPLPNARVIIENGMKESVHVPVETGWQNLWLHHVTGGWRPRGWPLTVNSQLEPRVCLDGRARCPDVVQFGILGEPDCDALSRLDARSRDERVNVHPKPHEPVRLGPDAYCPWNSQATGWRLSAARHMLLPDLCPGRCADIVRSYTVEGVVFTGPAVTQEIRNPHDLLQDFFEEIPLYLHADCWARDPISCRDSNFSEELCEAWQQEVSNYV